MIENKKLFDFDEVNSVRVKSNGVNLDTGEIGNETKELSEDESMETASTFPSILIPQTIVTLLCLILILAIAGNKDIHWAKWMRQKMHYAVNASTEETFGYISNLPACKTLLQNINNFIKLEAITQKVTSNNLYSSNAHGFQISVWPVQGNIIKNFGWTENLQSKTYEFNPGVLFQSVPGEEVAAIGDGEVTQITNQPGAGSIIIINHGSDWSSVYHNLHNVKVNIGQAVRAGEFIAQAIGKDLFLEVKHNEEPVDPSTMINNQNNAAI
jgi:murein DD-endopeptidase MepM/ murein hydrolase activator NlpD